MVMYLFVCFRKVCLQRLPPRTANPLVEGFVGFLDPSLYAPGRVTQGRLALGDGGVKEQFTRPLTMNTNFLWEVWHTSHGLTTSRRGQRGRVQCELGGGQRQGIWQSDLKCHLSGGVKVRSVMWLG